jgi:hypothetical protein
MRNFPLKKRLSYFFMIYGSAVRSCIIVSRYLLSATCSAVPRTLTSGPATRATYGDILTTEHKSRPGMIFPQPQTRTRFQHHLQNLFQTPRRLVFILQSNCFGERLILVTFNLRNDGLGNRFRNFANARSANSSRLNCAKSGTVTLTHEQSPPVLGVLPGYPQCSLPP